MVDKTLRFTSGLSENEFWKLSGKYGTFTINDKPSQNIIRFFEGAVVKAFFYQNPNSGWENLKDCREALKLEFNGMHVIGIDGKQKTVPRSMTDLNRDECNTFVETIIAYMVEQGYSYIPDSENYNTWRDSAPMKGEEYPPLKRVMEAYKKEKGL